MDPVQKEQLRSIVFLAGLARDFCGTGEYENISHLNRRLGYCEAVMDLLGEIPQEMYEESKPPAPTSNEGEQG